MMRSVLRWRPRGQSLVEFAVILPIFMLMLCGIFDLGRAVMYYNTISNASREAVRVGIVDQNYTAIRQRAVDNAGSVMPLPATAITPSVLAPDLTTAGTCAGSPDVGCVMRVRIQYTFQPATPFVGQISLDATTNQAIERRYASP